MQCIIKYEILLFMINSNLLTTVQHLLVPGKFRKSNFLSILNTLTDATEQNLEVDLVYLDFAMVKDFLSNRRQQLRVTPHYLIGHQSSALPPKGVPLVIFIYIIYKRFTKAYSSEIISICRRHKASSSIISSSLRPRAIKWHKPSNWMVW